MRLLISFKLLGPRHTSRHRCITHRLWAGEIFKTGQVEGLVWWIIFSLLEENHRALQQVILTYPDSDNTQHTYVGVFVAFIIQQVRHLSQSDPWLEPLYEKKCRIKISFSVRPLERWHSSSVHHFPNEESGQSTPYFGPPKAPLLSSAFAVPGYIVSGIWCVRTSITALSNLTTCKILILVISVHTLLIHLVEWTLAERNSLRNLIDLPYKEAASPYTFLGAQLLMVWCGREASSSAGRHHEMHYKTNFVGDGLFHAELDHRVFFGIGMYIIAW